MPRYSEKWDALPDADRRKVTLDAGVCQVCGEFRLCDYKIQWDAMICSDECFDRLQSGIASASAAWGIDPS